MARSLHSSRPHRASLGGPDRARRARRRAGLSMVETAALVCLAGVFLAIFIPVFFHELRTSKISEATDHLELLHQRSAAYFAAEHPREAGEEGASEEGGGEAGAEAGGEAGGAGEAGGEGLEGLGGPEGEAEAPPAPRHCLPPMAGPTPRLPSAEPMEVAFTDEETPGHATWAALGFAPEEPVRYSYTFEPTSAGCGLRSPHGTFLLTLRAEGDLDGDGERSLFERRAAAEDGHLVPMGVLYIRDRVE